MTFENRNLVVRKYLFLGMISIFVLFSIIETLVGGGNFLSFIRFLFSQVIIVTFGFTFLDLLRIDFDSIEEEIFTAYAIGFVVSVVIYIILLTFGIQRKSIYVTLILFIICVTYFFVLRKANFELKKKDFNPDSLFISVIFFVLILSGFFINLSYNKFSLKTGNDFINQDYLYWVRNSISATKSFPLPELSAFGVNLYYHYFSNLFIAYLHFITGIEVVELSFLYSYLINSILLLGSVYCFCNLFIQDSFYKYLSIFIILFTEGFQKFSVIYYMSHLYVNSFGLAEGLSLSFFSFYFFIRYFRDEKHSWKFCMVSMFVFFVAMGTKAPNACVVLASIGIGCFILLFNKKTWLKGLATGVSYLAIFMFVYFIFIQGVCHEPLKSTQSMNVSLTGTVLASYLYSGYKFVLGILKLRVIAYLSCFIVWSILANPLIDFLLFSSILITRKIKQTSEDFLLLVASFASFLLTVFISQTGHSQMYFYFSFIPFVTIYAFSRFEKNEVSPFANKKFSFMFYGLLIVCFLNAFVFLGKYVYSGIQNLLGCREYNSKETGLTVSQTEMQGLEWIKRNTSDSDIFVTNKILGEFGSRSFICSVFTERQMYIEGFDYTSYPVSISKEERFAEVYSALWGNETAINILVSKGVNYMIIFRNLPYGNVLNEKDVVYENNELFIVKLK